ncbi:glycosyltransferase [bacterium]|nr:glycosyltransferase [bacterium]
MKKPMEPQIVSAIVSTYKSERFIRGCLEDLVNQTQYLKGQLEIIIIDSASPESEAGIIRQFRKDHPNIRYLRTPERESLYAAWNRGIEMASGTYLTNANSDDRHRRDALEVMAATLERHPEVDLVYGDCHVSTIPNETYEENDGTRLFRYPDFFAPAALLHYQFGPQPMWRKSVHAKVGCFDGSFRAAGDYDFNLRFALECRALHIPEPLGLYLEHESAITFKDDTMARENRRIADTYRKPDIVERLYRQEGVSAVSESDRARLFIDMGNRALEYYPPWKEGGSECNIELAVRCCEKALELQPDLPAALNNRAVAACLTGNQSDALQMLKKAKTIDCDQTFDSNIAALSDTGDTGTLRLIPSELHLPSQRQLNMTSPAVAQTDTIARKPLTICMVASVGPLDPVAGGGGLECAMRQTAVALASRGHRVALVGKMAGEPGVYEGVHFLPLDGWRNGEFPAFSKEADILAFASGPDLGSYQHVGSGTARIALFHHQQLSFMTGTDPLRVLNELSDAVICVSDAVRDNLVRDGVATDRLMTVPNGVDHRVFYPRSVAREPHRIMFSGALVPDKNVHLLIEAFLLVQRVFPDAELHVCGSAALWGAEEYIDQDAVRQVTSNIMFHGKVSREELAVHYSRASICVIPSRFESFSLVSLEAQACGCVPLVADVGGVPETIERGETGFIYHPNDRDTLCQALLGLLHDPLKLSSAGHKAIGSVKRRFSWEKTAMRYEAVFYHALQKRRVEAPKQKKPLKEAIQEPKVSVIIPCYNYGRYLPDAVASVIAQTFQDFEIVIVNDGSTDNTREVAEQLIDVYPGYRIRLINQPNSGDPALSRNRGISEAQGEYILCLDADDMIMPEMLRETAAILESVREISIAYTDQIYFGAGVERVVRLREYDFSGLTQANIMGYCSLFRKKAWEDVGGFAAGIGYEDWDFWISCGENGHFAKRVPEPLFCYRQHSGGRYELDLGRDSLIRARIALRHPAHYEPATLAQARAIVGRPEMREDSGSFRVMALISAHNEGDVIYHVIGDLIRQGVQVYLLDHCSTDNTVAEASRWLGKGLIHIENFPKDAGYPEANEKQYIWSQILKRKEELAAQLDADWFIHSDADEFREAPWPGLTLAEGIRVADAQGYSALDFELLNFRPVNNDFVPGSDIRLALRHYEPCEDFNALQIKAWKNLRLPVRIVDNGGHDISFDGRRVFPVKFILRHYPIRSQSHGLRKVFAERKQRFNSIERNVGWHVQYDHIASEKHNFLHDPARLPVYDGNAVRLSVLSREAVAMAADFAKPGRENQADRTADDPCTARQVAGSERLRAVLRPFGTGYRGRAAATP